MTSDIEQQASTTGSAAAPEDGSGRAVILGAGIAGLLAAAALAPSFDEVLLLERDRWEPEQGREVRRGVPQGNHLHLLLMRGAQTMQQLVPGLDSALRAAGVQVHDMGTTMLCRGEQISPSRRMRMPCYTVSRPVLEDCLRTEVLALPNVRLRQGAPVADLYSRDHRRVDGVVIVHPVTTHSGPARSPEVVPAALVVDASGRMSQSHRWIQELGVAEPVTETIDGKIGYVTAWIDELGPLAERPILYVFGKYPHLGRRAGATQVEGGRAVLVATGREQDQPPTDHQGLVRFFNSMGNPVLDELAAKLTPRTPLYRYAKLVNRRYRYQMRNWPPGLLIVGDALAFFNPLYGQGMTVAALQARILARQAARLRSAPAASRRVQRKVTRETRSPWAKSTVEDLCWAGDPSRLTLAKAYLQAMTLSLAMTSEPAFRALLETMHMVSKVAMYRPQVLLPVLKKALISLTRNRRRRSGSAKR